MATRDACKRSLQAMAADDALAQSKALLLEKRFSIRVFVRTSHLKIANLNDNAAFRHSCSPSHFC